VKMPTTRQRRKFLKQDLWNKSALCVATRVSEALGGSDDFEASISKESEKEHEQ